VLDVDPDYQSGGALACTPSGYGFAWTTYLDGIIDIYMALIDPDGVFQGAPVLLTGDWHDYVPSVAYDGTDFLVYWAKQAGGHEDLYRRWVGGDGMPQGVETQMIDDATPSSGPLLVAADVGFGLLYTFGSELRFDRLDDVGDMSGAQVLSSQQAGADMVWDGSGFQVTWSEGPVDQTVIMYARLDATGTVVVGPTQVSLAASAAYWPKVLPVTGGALVAWTDWSSGEGLVHAGLVEGAGQVAVSEFQVALPANEVQAVDLMPNPAGAGLVWFGRTDQGVGTFVTSLQLCPL